MKFSKKILSFIITTMVIVFFGFTIHVFAVGGTKTMTSDNITATAALDASSYSPNSPISIVLSRVGITVPYLSYGGGKWGFDGVVNGVQQTFFPNICEYDDGQMSMWGCQPVGIPPKTLTFTSPATPGSYVATINQIYTKDSKIKVDGTMAIPFTVVGSSGTLTASPNPCVIAVNASSCTTTLTWFTANPPAGSTSAVTSSIDNSGNPSTNFHVSSPDVNNGTQGVTIPFNNGNGRNFYLYNNNHLLATVLVSATCSTGSVWNGNSCAPNDGQLSGTLTASPNPCVIAVNASSCTTTLTWFTANPPAGSTSAVTSSIDNSGNPSTNFHVSSPDVNNGTQGVTIPFNNGNGRNFYLYNNNHLLATVLVTTCSSGSSLIGNSCESYNVTSDALPNGTISPSGLKQVPYNSTPQFTVTPYIGYTASVEGTCGGKLAGDTYTADAITKDCSVIAKFSISTSSSPMNGNCGSANGQTYSYGSTNNSTSFSENLCSPGTTTPSNVPFPSAGSTVNWWCTGIGSNATTSPTCYASQKDAGGNLDCDTTHYSCVPNTNLSPISSQVEGIDKWTWNCPNGTPSGTTCMELKKKPTYIEN